VLLPVASPVGELVIVGAAVTVGGEVGALVLVGTPVKVGASVCTTAG
jgi:hypothetical protein